MQRGTNSTIFWGFDTPPFFGEDFCVFPTVRTDLRQLLKAIASLK